jgi:Txe/YoeB family toxin of Txe-Axe toxin-antitoxin module
MIYKIEFSEAALEQISALRKGDKNTYVKCFDLVLAIAENPREGIGKPDCIGHYKDH